MTRIKHLEVCCAVTLALSATTLFAQDSGGGVSRVPGDMVKSGMARHAAFIDGLLAAPTITETESDSDPWEDFYAEAVDILFDSFSAALGTVLDALLLRAGADPADLALSDAFTAVSGKIQPPRADR